MKKVFVLMCMVLISTMLFGLATQAAPITEDEAIFWFWENQDEIPTSEVWTNNVELSLGAIDEINALKVSVTGNGDPYFRMHSSQVMPTLKVNDVAYTKAVIMYYYQGQPAEGEVRQAQLVMNMSNTSSAWISQNIDLKCNEWTIHVIDLEEIVSDVANATVHQLGINAKGAVNGGNGYAGEVLYVKYLAFIPSDADASKVNLEYMTKLYKGEDVNDTPSSTPSQDPEVGNPDTGVDSYLFMIPSMVVVAAACVLVGRKVKERV